MHELLYKTVVWMGLMAFVNGSRLELPRTHMEGFRYWSDRDRV